MSMSSLENTGSRDQLLVVEPASTASPPSTSEAAAAMSNGTARCSKYRDLPYRSSNETLKMHSTFAVKLSEAGAKSGLSNI